MRSSMRKLIVAGVVPLLLAPALGLAEREQQRQTGAQYGQQAQQQQQYQRTQQRQQLRGEQAFIEQKQRGQFGADDLIGKSLRNMDDQRIGEITDLLIDDRGQIAGVLIEVDRRFHQPRALTDERAERRAAQATERRYERDRGTDVSVRDEREFAIRWQALDLSMDNGEPNVRVDLDADDLEQAGAFQSRDDRQYFAMDPQRRQQMITEQRQRTAAAGDQQQQQQRERTLQRERDRQQAGERRVERDHFVQRKEDDHFTAHNLIGSAVLNQEDDEIGRITDVLMDREGNIAAVVIGVGGFLGMGEREVALQWDAVELRTDDRDRPQIQIDVDRRTLQRAPEFERDDGNRR
jgi:ribosomal 30S subunit maturation factor RimM